MAGWEACFGRFSVDASYDSLELKLAREDGLLVSCIAVGSKLCWNTAGQVAEATCIPLEYHCHFCSWHFGLGLDAVHPKEPRDGVGPCHLHRGWPQRLCPKILRGVTRCLGWLQSKVAMDHDDLVNRLPLAICKTG